MRSISVDLGRPWPDDDPTDWLAVSIDRPHDRDQCLPCQWAYIWTDNTRVYSSEHRAWVDQAFGGTGVYYPLRFRAALDHRNAVRRAHDTPTGRP